MAVLFAEIKSHHKILPAFFLAGSFAAFAEICTGAAIRISNLETLGKRDCAVWRIDMRDINRNLPEKYKKALSEKKTFIFSVDTLLSVADSIDQYDEDMQDRSFICLEPPSIDQRIVNQYSFFTMIPNGISDLESFLDEHTENTVRYIINKDLRWNLRDMLDQFNINERMVYPGEDGIAAWLARHYYVKG